MDFGHKIKKSRRKHHTPIPPKPGYLVAVSDLHKGHAISVLQDNLAIADVLNKAQDQAKHLVYVGDIFELRYLLKPPEIKKRDVIKGAVDSAFNELDKLLSERPDRNIYFILGNHENIRRFRKGLDMLEEKHPNFEWHPEAIKIGDTLFTHGDLQEWSYTDKRRKQETVGKATHHLEKTSKVTKAEDKHTWVGSLYPWANKIYQRPGKTRRQVESQLVYRAGLGTEQENKKHPKHAKELFHYSEGGNEHLLTLDALDKVTRVVFGHTHIPFTHRPDKGRHYFNLGSTTRGFVSTPKDLGFIAGYVENGNLTPETIVAYNEFDADKAEAQHVTRLMKKTGALVEGLYPDSADTEYLSR